MTEDATLYAKYTPKTVNINYHDRANVETETITFEQSGYELKKPSRTDYVFKGWYKDSGFTQKVDNSNLWQMVDDNKKDTLTLDLYAKWQKEETTTETTTENTTREEGTETTSRETTQTTTNTTSATNTTTENSTETTTNTTTENSTETTTNTTNTTSVTTENTTEATSRENTTEVTTNENRIPPVIEESTETTSNDTTEEIEAIQQQEGAYIFGNLQVITPEHEEMARQAIANIVPDGETADRFINDIMEDMVDNGAKINERRLTEKPAFGFSEQGGLNLLWILLLILIILIIIYIIKKQIIDKEKQKDDEENEESLQI